MKYAAEAFKRVVACTDVQTILDVGSGDGEHARAFTAHGKQVTTISLRPPADYVADYLETKFEQPFDALWCSHVLEHQVNVNLFLRKCFQNLREHGVLAVTVPTPKHYIVGGHVTLWNAGLLLYNLVLAGFDCCDARVSGEYGYNISVVVRKQAAKLPSLTSDAGDIAKLSRFFPIAVVDGFDGRLPPINW